MSKADAMKQCFKQLDDKIPRFPELSQEISRTIFEHYFALGGELLSSIVDESEQSLQLRREIDNKTNPRGTFLKRRRRQ